MSIHRLIARKAVSSSIRAGVITAVEDLNAYTVQVPGHVDHYGNDVPFRGLRSLANVSHAVGERVLIAHVNSNRPKMAQMWIILDAAGQTIQSAKVLGQWPRRRYDQQRTGRVEDRLSIPALGTVTTINAHPTQFMRQLTRASVQVGAADVWVGSSTRAVEWSQVLADSPDRLYVVEDGLCKVYLRTDLTTALGVTGLADVELEAVLLSSGVAVAHSPGITYWVWSLHNAASLSLIATNTMDWNGWTAPRGLSNSAVGGPYPIIASVEPLYSHEACGSQRVQPITVGDVIVAPGDDYTFTDALLARRETPMDYEADEWIYCGQERSQVQAWRASSGTQAWSFNYDNSIFPTGSNGGMTPVLAVGNNVIAHWERTDFAEVTFQHFLADPTIDAAWIAAYKAAHIEFGWVLPSIGQPWGNDDNAPQWAWDYNYSLAALIAPLLASLAPSFSAEITRDYQANLTHGMVAINSGVSTASIEWGTADSESPYTITTDNGDPLCSAHFFETDPLNPPAFAPRTMYDGTFTTGSITLAPADTTGYASLSAYLRDHSLMDATDDMVAYVAAERFQGNLWNDDFGGTQDEFWQGHIWYGGTVGVDGISTLTSPPFVYVHFDDPDNRWDHDTIEVTYHYCFISQKVAETTWSDSRYGFDPFNAVASSNKIVLLPRRIVRPMPTTMPVYWPDTDLTGDGALDVTLDSEGNVIGGTGHSEKTGFNLLSAIYITRPDQQAALFAPLDRSQVDPTEGAWDTTVTPVGYGNAKQLKDGTYVWARGFQVVLAPANTLESRPAQLNAPPAFYSTGWYGSAGGDPAENHFVPAHGYWYDGGDPRDPNNWTPVDWRRLDTGLRGIKGDIPRGGSYHPPSVLGSTPRVPYYGEGTPCTMLCLNATTLAEEWRVEFGYDVPLSAAPAAFIHGEKLYVAMFAPAVTWLNVDGVSPGSSFQMIRLITDSLTTIAGGTATLPLANRNTIETLTGLAATPAVDWWTRFIAMYNTGPSAYNLPTGMFLSDGSLSWPVLFEYMRAQSFEYDARVPLDAITGIGIWAPSIWTAPASVTAYSLADGSVLDTITVDVAVGSKNIDLVVLDGRIVLTADDGRHDITSA